MGVTKEKKMSTETTQETPVSETEQLEESGEQESTEVLAEGEANPEPQQENLTKEETKQLIKQLKLKVNGKEIIEELPVEVPVELAEFLTKKFQLARVGQMSMQELAEHKKQQEQKMQLYKQNPWLAIEELGFDPLELSEKKIDEVLEQAKKSPEQLEQERIQQEVERLRNELKKREDDEKQRQQIQLEEEARDELENEIVSAIEAHKNLPKDANFKMSLIRKVADTMAYAFDKGITNIKAEQVLPAIVKEHNAMIKNIITSMSDKEFEEYVGKEFTDRLRKARLNSTKKVPQNLSSIKDTGSKTDKDKSAKKIKSSEFFKMLGRN
jgi:hypothetical protein